MMNAVPKVELRRVRKSFGTLEVIKGVNLTVERGELVCLIGSSGSGKSTLLRCLNLLEPIDEGEILLDGSDISHPMLDPQPIRQRIGLVFQSFNLFPHMNAFENVMLAPRLNRKGSRAELTPRIEALFERFDLSNRMDHFPDQLSGGQQQRVAIVRAMAMQPEIMLFDEVTSALDPELVSEVLDVVRQLKGEGMTLMLATHEMGFAREAADKVCFLEKGVIVEEGPPSQIFQNPREDRTRQFLSSVL